MTRAPRCLLERYATTAGLPQPISPHRLRHFLLTWIKKQGIDDALIQPYSGHASRQSIEIYSRLAIADAQAAYAEAMGRFRRSAISAGAQRYRRNGHSAGWAETVTDRCSSAPPRYVPRVGLTSR